MQPTENRFFAPQAWVNGAWAYDVLLTIDATGDWSGIAPDATLAQREGAKLLAGPVLPGVVNAHSHAFQRAIAGLTERRGDASLANSGVSSDDFWSWRERMYAAALRLSPEQLEHIAAFLYTELLG